MKIVYGKILSEVETISVKKIADECNIAFDTARLLFYRGIDDVKKAKKFLSAGKHNFHDPFLLKGMREAVKEIERVKSLDGKILVFGDYDADGVCASTVLSLCLKEYGVKSLAIIPEREDGYGLNPGKVFETLKTDKIDLVITVDCGISDREKIAEIQECGISVIVTDHHVPPDILPDCIVINPRLKGQAYPFEYLAGAGVAYKLGHALIGDAADKFLDYVALATVADSMDLNGENRDIVTEGLKLFKHPRKAFSYLISDSSKEITSHTLAYQIAPRVNAGGRMGDALTALKLFTTSNENEMFELAAKLNSYNAERQSECEKIYTEAKNLINENGYYKEDFIVVSSKNWKAGFIGIVASRLVEDYARPVLVFAENEGVLKGSGRCPDELNLLEMLNAVSDLFVTYGGHSQAAGVTMTADNEDVLRKRLNVTIKEKCASLAEEKIYADWDIDASLSMRFGKEIELLEPFGTGNPKPVFTARVNSIKAKPLKNGSPHYAFSAPMGDFLDFNGEKDVLPLRLPLDKFIVFEPNYSIFRGKESLKGFLKKIVFDEKDGEKIKPYLMEDFLAKLKKSEVNALLSDDGINKNDVAALKTERNDMIDVYNELCANVGKRFDGIAEFYEELAPSVRACDFVFAVAVFMELGFFENKNDKLIRNSFKRADLNNSVIYKKICDYKGETL